MRGAIASEAGKRAGKTPAQVVELVQLVSAADVDLFASLVAADIDGDVVVQAAATVTGMPAAPRLLLKNPSPPHDLDAVGIRDAGGVPIGSVQGRTWIAFSDPEAARAAVFSDDVVVCLAVSNELRRARDRFNAEHPETAANDTLAMPAVTPEAIEQWRRQNAIAGPRTELHVSRPTLASANDAQDDEDLFDQSGGVPKAPGPTALVDDSDDGDDSDEAGGDAGDVTVDRNRQPAMTRSEVAFAVLPDPASHDVLQTAPGLAPTAPSPPHAILDDEEPLARSLDPDRLRLLRLAQLGRLRRFRFERVLGSGGMATVYLARAADAPDQPVAVKVLEPHLREDAVAVGRFRRELRTLKALHHPRIVAPIDGDAEDNGGVLWLSCRYLDGGTLVELIERVGPLPPAAAVPIIAAVLEGLVHAHAHGVVHRDLKPHNVLLDNDGSLCIADFGVARAVDDVPLTKAGARFGTPAYMSPEQATGGVVDERSDLFSAGVLLYHLVSGHNPFARSSVAETMAAVARADVPALPPVLRLPAVVSRLLEALLARAVDARPPDAASALRTLQPLLARLPPIDVVVKRLLADPRAFAGVGVVDLDANDSTIAEPAGSSDDDHSAFGAVPGLRATIELPLSALGPGGLAALQEQTIAGEDADRTADGDSDNDDVEEDGGRGVAAIIGFAVAGALGLLFLVIWWLAHRAA